MFTMQLFFRYDKDMFKKRDPFIIEIGFNIYFLLWEMEEHLKYELDEDYAEWIISLLPPIESLKMKVNHNIFIETINFIRDVFVLIFSYMFCCFCRSKWVNHKKIMKIKDNTKKIRWAIMFYAMNSTMLEIQKEG